MNNSTKNYQLKISEVLKKNVELSNEIDDLIRALKSNDEVICINLPKTIEFNKVHNDLLFYLTKYIDLIYEKAEIESNINILDKLNEELPNIIINLKNDNDILKNNLKNILRTIYLDYKIILKNRKKNNNFKTPIEEKFIIAPTKNSIKLYLKNKEIYNSKTLNTINNNTNNNDNTTTNAYRINEVDKDELELLQNRINIIQEQINLISSEQNLYDFNEDKDIIKNVITNENNNENNIIINNINNNNLDDSEKDYKNIDNLYYNNENLKSNKIKDNKDNIKPIDKEDDHNKIIFKDDPIEIQIDKYLKKIDEFDKDNSNRENQIHLLRDKYKKEKNNVLDLLNKINNIKSQLNNTT